MSLLGSGEPVRAVDARDAQLVRVVPARASLPLRCEVVGLGLPRDDALLRLPVADGDAEAVGAGGVEGDEAGLLPGELEHAVGRLGVAVAGLLVTARGEDHGVV